MRVSDFDYDLPKKFIAQNPLVPRDTSKLMVCDCAVDKIFHRQFFEIVEYLKAGDVLVVNRSKVIPARVVFELNGRECEIFLLKKYTENVWQGMVRPGKFFSVGLEFKISDNISGRVLFVFEDGTRKIEFFSENEVLSGFLEKVGQTPLPPYIVDSSAQPDQYQTVYANEEGSVAAPTAGLHFTSDLIDQLKRKGVEFVEIVLHVGRGTFLPVKSEFVKDHVMHEEFFCLDKDVVTVLNKARDEKRRIIAVGTTSVRVLESCYDPKTNSLLPKTGATDIFIYPGNYKWKVVDALITNFHLPKSTLIMLVASFLEGKGVYEPVSRIFNFYEIAKKNDYRFYSFGDAMFIF